MSIMRQWEGPLSRQLLLEPGRFGLGKLPSKSKPDAVTTMVCGYCSTGCSLQVHLKGGHAVGLTPDPEYPVNLGMACPKGWEALEVLKADDRGTTPLLKGAAGRQKAVGWEAALRTFSTRFKGIMQEHGPESVAFLSTGQIPTEEMALLGAVAKFGMGMIHCDSNTRQCMATSAVAYKQSFGFDAPPYSYADFEESDVIVLIGSNLCIAHPILWERVLRNRHQPKIIVIDPRKTETAMAATEHLAISPKSDLALFYGIAHILVNEGWVDAKFVKAHTSGFDEFSSHLKAYTPRATARRSGIPESQIHALAKSIHDGKRVSFWWTMGVNQGYEAVRTAQAIINVALMTGNIGKPGTGANSITGQCNAMGSRLFGNATNLLGGHDFLNAAHREKIAGILGIEASKIPAQNSLAYDQIIEQVIAGKIKGLWIIATNTAHSWIHQKSLKKALAKLDFLVVQDMYSGTETAKLADLYLPAAGWGEKEGTFINSERRFGVLKRVAQAPGQALSDFAIFKLIAHSWGVGKMFEKWGKAEDVFQALKKISEGQPCDFSGISGYKMIEKMGGIQWPFPAKGASTEPQRRLFEDGRFYHADHKAKFLFEKPMESPQPLNKEFPLMMLSGRGTASQWHTQTRSSKSAVLRKLYPQKIYVEINPADAAERGVKASSQVEVYSRAGSIRARAQLTRNVAKGTVFIPMHYEGTNVLTLPDFDPYSRQPSYKATPVNFRNITNEESEYL